MTEAPEAQWERLQETVTKIKSETGRVIVGQEEIVEQLLTSLLCKGHCLLVGVPGLAKTLLVATLGKILGLKFQRIQFTPDLMPTDIVGSEILQDHGTGERSFDFVPGPIFANLLLADEINRTPPKTQAALLEAMQEKQVTVNGQTRILEEPFVVFATQNPIEHEGTYPLPEAQLDRFFFQLNIGYPSMDDEAEIVRRMVGHAAPESSALLDAEKVKELQSAAVDVPLPESVISTILKLGHATRPDSEYATEDVKNYVGYGAGPRASQCLAKAARALALLRGKPSASDEEVKAVALPVLRHRVIGQLQRNRRRHHHGPDHRQAREFTLTASMPRYLDPADVRRLKNYEFGAKAMVEGYLSGRHRFNQRGSSIEFHEFRAYTPGDDLARVDWRVFARNDKMFLRTLEQETNLECHVFLDCSTARLRWVS